MEQVVLVRPCRGDSLGKEPGGLAAGSLASVSEWRGAAAYGHKAVGVSKSAALGPVRPAPRPAQPLSKLGAALAAEGDIW
jgi:hypothetical protein